MSKIIHLERRTSHRYVGTYQHLDSWVDVGKAKVLAPRKVEDGNGYDEVGTYLLRAIIPAGQDAEQSRRALQDHFTSEGCSHDYDCCGCLSTRAHARQVASRAFSIRVRYSRNY